MSVVPSNARKKWNAHETLIERAARTIMANAGFGTARLRRAASNLPDNSYRVKFRRGDATGAQTLYSGYTEPVGEPDTRPAYHQFTGELEITYARRRSDNTESAISGVEDVTSEARGAIRDVFEWANYPFDETNLPELIVVDIMPIAGIETVDGEHHIDVITERFRLTYEARRTAVPSPSPVYVAP
jgi:hypothetical protein